VTAIAADAAVAPRPGRALDALGLARDPTRFLARRQAAAGDPFTVRLPGVGDVVVTGEPDGARDVFSAPPACYAPVRSNPVEPLLGPGSLILLGGDRHRRERKLMTPPFHGDRMRAYGEIIRDAALEELARWRPGDDVVAGDAAQAIALQVILRAVFGVQDPARRERLRRATVALLDSYTTGLVLVPALRRSFAGLGPWARFRRRRDAFDALLREEIAGARAAGGDRTDVLGLLLGLRYDDGAAMTDDQVLDELRTLLVAGHETAATAMVWALCYLHREPRQLEAVRAELAALGPAPSPEALAGAPYLGAVGAEAMRLHPVVPIALRRVEREVTVRGVRVAPGGHVAVAITLLHATPAVWPDADQFRPERFLERSYTPFEYAPFGGGHRRCLGAAFAGYELKIALGTILARTDLALADRRPPRPVLRNITMAPDRAVRLRVVGAR